MASRRQADKYWFSVEGETEKWYLEWLRDVVNADPRATRKVAFDVKVEKNPLKRAKSLNVVGKAEVWHVFDLEDEGELHVRQTQDTLKRMRDAGKLGRGVKYMNAYSNFTFELWILLHKLDMRAPLNHRTGYLRLVNREFGESYQDLDEYKHEGNFKRALGQLTIDDVVAAVARAKRIARPTRLTDTASPSTARIATAWTIPRRIFGLQSRRYLRAPVLSVSRIKAWFRLSTCLRRFPHTAPLRCPRGISVCLFRIDRFDAPCWRFSCWE